jgi:DNA (cytosine-5)-methyltransferase 1
VATKVGSKLYTGRGTTAAWYKGWKLDDAERERFRQTSLASSEAKAKALSGDCDAPKHPIPTPRLNPAVLMPQLPQNQLRGLSLFSGGGGLDLGFDRAGFRHLCSYEILEFAGEVLKAARPTWDVRAGEREGDVTQVRWSRYRGKVDVLHGGPPCQPFSHAGGRLGAEDVRDMFPELVRAVQEAQPSAFVAENVSGLATKRFAPYIEATIYAPLRNRYVIHRFALEAADFGVPQRRRRVFFVGFRDPAAAQRFQKPEPTHVWNPDGDAGERVRTMGAREALGLPSIGFDDLAPTIRSGLTGPRHSTSAVNSSTALKQWHALQIWPNGVAPDRQSAAAFVAKYGHFRLSVDDCMILQGFPGSWPFLPPVYKALGLIGNSVSPPMGYAVARSVADALLASV